MPAQAENSRIHGLSATNISSYHHYKCDRFLYNTYYGETSRKVVTEMSAVLEAQLQRGNRWEAELFSWLNEQNLLARVVSGVLDATDIQAVIETDERNHFYITGLHFFPPIEAFKKEYEKNGTRMPQFSIAKPDLLEIWRSEGGSYYWQILDAKASLNTKPSHHAQVYFYHRCMEHFLPNPRFVSMGTVSIWLPSLSDAGTLKPVLDAAHIKTYPTSLLVPILDRFLFRQLPMILAQNRYDVKWHFNPLCRGCPFEQSCRLGSTKDHKLGAMPNVSIDDADTLRGILELGRPAKLSDRLTDIEDLDRVVHSKSILTKLRSSHPSTLRRAQKILALPTKISTSIPNSPITAAALLGKIQVTQRRSYTFPKSEDITVIISLVRDPLKLSPAAFCISTQTSYKDHNIPKAVSGKIEQFILELALVLETILTTQRKHNPPLRTQCYVFGPDEREDLQRYLINAALTSDSADTSYQKRLKLCIGAICEGAALLSTSFQPLVLSAAFLNFLSKDGQRTSSELRICLERLGLPVHGTDGEMRFRIQAEIDRLKAEGNRNTNTAGIVKGIKRAELGLIPRIVVVKRELRQLLALPIPGYWDLPESYLVLCPDLAKTVDCPTDEQIFADFTMHRMQSFQSRIQLRNTCIYNVIKGIRDRVNSTTTRISEILVNEARVLTSNFMDICVHDYLRKLFNMHQFEVLARLTSIWDARLEGCPDSPVLEFRGSRSQVDGSDTPTFSVKSGVSELLLDKERSFYDYILTEDVSLTYGDNESIPIEALFDDLAVSDVVFPLNRHTRRKWLSQADDVQSSLWVADMADMTTQGENTILALRTYGDCSFVPGKVYRLSPRLVDFNLVKILSTLLELDLQVSNRFEGLPPFLQLCVDSCQFSRSLGVSEKLSAKYLKNEYAVNRLFRELDSLDTEAAQSLILKPSQRKAMRKILLNRLSVIWGPPGTGKTYTLSLSVLRLLEIRSRCQEPTSHIILLTAVTHAAIQACLEKLEYLRNCYRRIPDLRIEWLDDLSIEHVVRGSNHSGPNPGQAYVYAGTVFQLYHFCKRFNLQSDCIIIDEAGQLGLGSASLVLRSLKEDGRVIAAGDNEQLAPIFSAEYPKLAPHLFGSILDCLMRPLSNTLQGASVGATVSGEKSQFSVIVQLTENFRLNQDLGEFVSTIYEKKFIPQKAQAQKVAISLQSLEECETRGHLEESACAFLVALSKAMLRVPQKLLRPPKRSPSLVQEKGHRTISLMLLRANVFKAKFSGLPSYEEHVKCEASLAASLVKFIRKAFPSESVFVATPHRLQRHAVNEILKLQSDDLVEKFEALRLSHPQPVSGVVSEKPLIRVDTIERLQGSEAAFVICLFSYPVSSDRAAGVHFLLQRRRLNVAISRARTLCILITSDAVMNPEVGVFANAESLKGYTFLKAFEDRAWTGIIDVNLNTI